MKAVNAVGLTKLHGKDPAVENLTLEIEEGEIIGVLGPKGAGKTTLLQVLAGVLQPDKGQCFICGRSVKDTRYVRSICGAVTHSAALYEHLTGLDNLTFFASLYDIDPSEARLRASALMKKLKLWDKREERLSEFTDGEKLRLSLARALLHQPKLLLCDFESSHMDVETEKLLGEVIAEQNRERNLTVCLFSRDLGDMAELCTGYSLFHEGKLLATGSYEYLRGLADLRLTCRIRCNKKPSGFRICDEYIERDIDKESEMADLLRRLIGEGADVFESQVIYPTVTEIYSKMIKESRKNH